MEEDTAEKAAKAGAKAPKKRKFKKANIEIGQRILYLRLEVLNIGEQKDFAAALGVTRGAVGNWELGRGISRESLKLIVDRFDISHEWLVYEVGKPKIQESFDRKVARLLPREHRESFYRDIEALLQSRAQTLEEAAGNSVDSKKPKK